jgi:acyl-coenzyme A thioesterase PaaI-like protein
MTVELKVSFIEPGEGKLIAEGRCLRAGKSLAFCEGEVRDQSGKLVAKALGTFMLRRARNSAQEGAGDG